MAKAKKSLSVLVIALFTVFTVLSYVPAQAKVATPKLQVVAQPAAEYTPADTISFTVNAPNYSGKVMYRVILYNGTTKETVNLWNTYKTGYYYTGWTPAGTYPFQIHWSASQLKPGPYSMTVLVKRVGSTAKYEDSITTKSFFVKSAASITSLGTLSDVKVLQGDAVTLPATVKATYSDGTTKDVAVTWPAVDTTKTGFVKVEGTVAGTTLKPAVNVLVVAKALNVESVSVIDASTLKVVGDALDQLKAENITIADNTVTAVKPAADLKSAEVTLENKLAPNAETVVKIGDKEFKVTYGFVVNSVSVVSATFDDDTASQQVGLKVNGVDADFDYLAAAGYTVEFNALDKDDVNANATLFAANPSTDGTLLDTLPIGDYKVQVTITKGSTVLVSDYATIKVRNLDNTASSITDYTIHNNDLGADQNSTTLVVGETADITEIEVTTGSAKSDVTSGIEVKSSNSGVVSVNPTTYTMTAEAPGTATITITYGDLTKTFTMTVASKAREVAKVAPDKSSLKMVVGKTATMDLTVTDQYGDPIVANAADINEVYPSNFGDYITSVTGTNSGNNNVVSIADGTETLTFVANSSKGSGTIYFKDTDGKIIGSLGISVTDVDNVAKKVIEIDSSSDSDDNKLDMNDDNTVTYRIAQYNTNGVYNGNVNLAGYKVKFNQDIVEVDGDTDGEATLVGPDTFTVTAVDEGSTDVAVYNTQGDYVGKVTVQVVKSSVKITGVQWKSPGLIDYAKTIKATTVLDIVDSADDDIVKGITLSESTVHKIRITTAAALYIDKNDNGVYDAGTDTDLGTLTVKKSSDSTIADGSTDPITGISVVRDEKGTIIFSVLNTSGEVISSTSVKVDVK